MAAVFVAGVIALVLSIVPLIVAVRRKNRSKGRRLGSEETITLMGDTLGTEAESDEVLREITSKYISSISSRAIRGPLGKEGVDAYGVRVNTDVLFHLPFLPVMTVNRMVNTVTDVLGLELSPKEKRYARYIIRKNIDACKRSLPEEARESVGHTFERVLRQI